ncbi:MAG: CRISPR-associated helicase Cas3' [Caldilineaceae bacterium]|nr:CRISPR-associated helicase Cas3' [Caldilineaceae bacterium]
MALYPYQERVKALIQQGRSVVLQAPTGCGKTRAALAPYIEAFFNMPPNSFPRKCIYSVPMRVLASQFEAEYASLALSYNKRFRTDLQVRIQTGERSEDPQFLEDMIFATIDQSLSSALAVPYSLSPGRANMNAGAIYSSYLVFDEFHLFPSGENGDASGALVTTLQLLAALKGVVPFVLMTATFSSTMLAELASRLGAEVVTVSVEEYAAIASGKGKTARRRFFHTQAQPVSADAVLTAHAKSGVTRSIVVCNQVARAQNLYESLRDHPQRGEIEVRLLHSRFLQTDRQGKEEEIRREFGKDADKRQIDSLILVATQVVEVGLDITCDRLHTEIAPANAVLQRAGRCARYPGEEGQVCVYPVPMRQRRPEDEEKPDFMPYNGAICQASWESFARRDGQEIDFQVEQAIVDEVHTEGDRQLLAVMDRQRSLIWDQIFSALELHDRAQRQELIRHIDSVTVLAGPTPEAVGNPYAAQGFSFHRGSVFGLLRSLQEFRDGWVGAEFEEPPWLMALPIVDEGDGETPGSVPSVRWQQIADTGLLNTASVVVVNSAFVHYSEEIGFQIVPAEEANGWSSAPGSWPQGNSRRPFVYDLESYGEHISQMLTVYQREFGDDYAYVERRLTELGIIPTGGLDQAVRLAIACHDTAKMDNRWQKWVRLYQKGIGEPIGDGGYMAVHTHHNPNIPAHVAARKAADRQSERPPHAGESAFATKRIVAELSGNPALGRAVLTAIARHHSTGTERFKPFALDPAATATVAEAIVAAGLPAAQKTVEPSSPAGGLLDSITIKPREFHQLLLYLWVVRLLRLCDGLSQEE